GTVIRNTDTTSELVVDLTSSDADEAVVPASVTIPAGSEMTTFTITGVGDEVLDGDQSIQIQASRSGFQSSSVNVVVIDVDFQGISVAHTDSATTIFETGLDDEVYVVLSVAPQGDVVIDLASSDIGRLTTDRSSLTFTIDDWNIPQVVRVFGVDDGLIDAPEMQSITLSVNDAVSDESFHSAVAESVAVTIIDQDFAPLSVTVVEGALVYSDSQNDTKLLNQAISGAGQIVNTGALNDNISLTEAANGSSFVINSQNGDDVIVLASLAGNEVNGGAGFDRLEIESVQDLDWAGSASQLQLIEEIVLRGTGITNFMIDPAMVISISEQLQRLVIHMGDLENSRLGANWNAMPPTIVGDEVHHVAVLSGATLELVNRNAWQNPFDRFDVNRSGNVSPLDALVILNYLNSNGSKVRQPSDPPELLPFYYDSNGDDRIAPLDALVILNQLNRQSAQAGGEASQSIATIEYPKSGTRNDDDDKLLELLAYDHMRIGSTTNDS
ncbi:MAG: dockerin type I domain-containing protein, partial [Pirellulaceae bacterium]